MKLRISFDILIIFILLILNFIIKNYNFYFLFIYFMLSIYNIYIFSIILLDNQYNNNIFKILRFIFFSIFLYFLTYFIICDPNPIFYFISYYIFFSNFFKAILIIIIHTYFLSIFYLRDNFDILNNEDNYPIHNNKFNKNFYIINYYFNLKNYFFLSNFIKICTRNKKNFILFFLSLIILFSINSIVFLNIIKLKVYFYNKQINLPISSSKNTTFYITAMVVNMEKIINNFIEEIKKLIIYLGEKKVIISIVENGDSKDKTREYLNDFQIYLNKKKIINKFFLKHEVDDPRKKIFPFRKYCPLRIKYYSLLRNKCLDFLYDLPNLDFNNTKIIFFNDIYFKFEDIINLISTNNEDYNAVCGMDFSNIFYDRWVSIDLDGNSLLKNFPFFLNKEAQDLIINHKPIRVFSCWNGVTIFTASPLKNKNIKFRYKRNNKKLKYKINNCQKANYESECTYLHIDLFKLGYSKKFINPNVRVAYKYKFYNKRKYFYPSFKDIISYFNLYLKSFKIKRNKFMSNYKDKNIKFNKMVENWYLENK